MIIKREKRMCTITIVTPTYNRKSELHNLYDSLLKQSCKDFKWLIIDDGSQDGTENYLKAIVEEKKLDIKYVKRENGGKHRALNQAFNMINTELTFIVDSDDILPVNSIETILIYHGKYMNYNDNAMRENKRQICGYSFLRCHEDGTVNTAYFPQDELIDSYLNVRINGNIGGDKAEVFYTDVLKKYPFKEYDNEKFMPEDAVWMQISDEYDMVHINQNIYTCEYLEGGLTRNGRKMKIKSPRGMMFRSKVYIENPNVNLKTRIKMIVLFIIYKKFNISNEDVKLADDMLLNKLLYIFLYYPSIIVCHKWKKELQA